jgi:hypothetical protein
MTENIDVDLGAGRQRSVPVDLPGNSRKLRAARAAQETPREKKQEKIVTGEVIQRKKRLRRRFTEAFFGDERVGDALESFIAEILVSAFKSMVSDTVGQFSNALRDGSDKFLYGTTRRSITTARGPYTSYNRVTGVRPAYNQISDRGRTLHDFDEVILESRGEAEDVLDRMRELIAQFDVATVADFYDLLNITTGDFAAERWGWTDLRSAKVSHVRGGYLISMPRSSPLER